MTSELLTRAQRLETYAAKDPSNLDLLRDLADTYHRAGEHSRALEVLERAQAQEPDSSRWVPLRGKLLLAAGRWDEAVSVYECALQSEPDSAALLFNLAYAMWGSGADLPRAAQLMRQAAELRPDDTDIACNLAGVLEEAGAAGEAEQVLQRVLARDGRHDKALALLARLKLDAGAFDTASDLAGRCIAANPSKPAGWQIKGELALFNMDGASAAKHLRQALDLDPTDVDTRISLAQASMMQGRVRHGHALLNEAVQRDPSSDHAWCLLGWASLAMDDADGAATAFDRAHSLAADNPDTLAGQALLHLSKEQRDVALQLAQRALAIDGQHVIASLVIARTQEMAGRTIDSRELMQSAIASRPFGPLPSTLGQALQAGAESPVVHRLRRRFAKASQPPQAPAQRP